VLHADNHKFCLVLPAGVKDFVWGDRYRRGAEDTRGGPVVDRYRALLVLTNRQKFVTGWGELQFLDGTSMEVVQVSEHLASRDLPHEDVNHLGLALGGHLTCGYDVLPWVESHADHVLFVGVEEILNISSLVHHDAKGGSGERYVVLVDIPQVSSSIKASETVCVLEFKVAFRLSAHQRIRFLVDIGSRSIDLTLEGFDGHGLVTIPHFLFLEHVIFFITSHHHWSLWLRRSCWVCFGSRGLAHVI